MPLLFKLTKSLDGQRLRHCPFQVHMRVREGCGKRRYLT
jgi:hypothetical protein